MKRCSKYLTILLAVLAIMPQAVRAQANKPVAVISINKIDEILSDVTFVTKLAGAEALGPMIQFLSSQYLAGVDTSKPIGASVYFNPQTQTPEVLAFIPTKDLSKIIGLIPQNAVQIQDKGNGSYEIAMPTGQNVYIQDKSGWAYIGISKDAIASAPADPAKLLGTLPSNYDIAIQGNLSNVPKIFRDMAIAQIKQGAEATNFQQPGESEEAFQLRTRVMQMQLGQFEQVLNSLDTLTIGWAIDQKASQVYFDFGMTGIAGSDLAAEFAAMKDTTSKFAGFLMDGAAVTFNAATKIAEKDIAQLDTLAKAGKQQALAEIDKDGSIDDAVRSQVKQIVVSLIDVFVDTAKAGKIDMGGTLELKKDAMAFAAGVLLVDGKRLDKAFKSLIELAKNEPDFPQVKLNAQKHAGVDFHQITVPVPDEDARPFFGDNVEILVGTGEKSAYIAFGKGAFDLVKKAIDGSSAEKTVRPMQMNLALGPVLEFAQAIESNNDAMLGSIVAALQKNKGKDHLRISAGADGNGVRYRILVEEGILKLIGIAQQGGGGF